MQLCVGGRVQTVSLSCNKIPEFMFRRLNCVFNYCCDAICPNLLLYFKLKFLDEDDEEFYAEFGSATKKRRSSRSVKERKSAGNSFLKDLLSIERLSDSCIPQLLKTSFTTFLEDNVQHLQLKAISLISGIFYAYPQHRTYVMDKALQVLLKLPLSKRVPRTFHLPDEEQRQIQMITVLLIQLVHCSANLPESVRQVSNGSPISELPIDPSDPAKCHEAITDACCLFWNRVLHCLTSTKAQDVSELKAIIENLVTDLLTTLNLPEFPASAPILEVLCVLLLQNAGLKSKDIAARSMAIDLLGTIAARLKHDALLCRTEKFWVVQELMGRDDVDSKYPKDACSLCLDARNEKPLFVCQSCQRLFHVDCMGVREHEVPTNSLFCQFCLCRKELLVLESYCKPQAKDEATKDHGPVGKSSDASARIKKMEMVQQMLLNYLQDSGNADDMHLFICWFYLCLWYKDDTDPQRKFLCNLARLNSKATARDSGGASSLLTRGSVKKISLALGQNNSFSGGFDKILHVLLACLRQNSPVIRAKALRAVSIIVEADPEVLCDKHVQAAVEGRFLDSAISVREAALELVGRHIASHPDYFEKVAGRINDTGVSVQKRSIKIIRDMCTSNTNFSKFTNACTRIISRISDEESSIRDLVCKIFYEFWFKEPSDSRSNIFGDGSSVSLEVTKKTEQIVEMLQSMPSHQPLVTVIKCNLSLDFFPQSAKAVGINPMSLAAVRKRCELMCKCLLERILQVKEMDKEAEVCTFPYVLLLHAFCVVDPTFCAPASDPSQFVVTLQPYLKSQADNQVVVRLLESIIFVIDSVLLLRKLPQSVVEELEHELTQMIVRHSFLTVVHACIRCLCSVSKVACKGATVIEFLIQAFFNRLDALGLDNKKQVGRSLVCLGLLIRYGNSLLSASLSSRNIDVVRSLDLFKKYLQAEDFAIKVRSLQALGYVLIARPEFMLERGVGRILEATLSSSTDVRLKMQALQNMYEYLLDAESQLGIDDVGNNTVTSSTDGGLSVPVAASAGDTNICGGIIQLYWDSVLERCLDANDQVRQSALKIVKFVLHQGLVHPITCVPHLIALETDPLEANSDLAHYLLMNMNEKYPAFFESRLGDGLQLSFIFMQSMSRSSAENLNQKVQSKVPGSMKGKAVSASFANARFGVSRIYKLIHGNRISRNKFMSSVVRKFDMPSWNNSVISFLMYCAEILALLPFTLPDEPLYLIYAINRVIQVRAGGLEANMKSFLHLLHGDDGQKIHGNGTVHQDESVRSLSYDPTMCVDANEGVQLESADHQVPNDTAFMDLNSRPIILDSSCGISEVEIQKIQADCLGAAALQLLLKLKRHLKIVYSLDDARCQAFSPNDVLKPGRTLSQQNIPFNLSEIRIDLPTTYPDLLQRYQEFKNALRDDTVDYSTYIANIKRKRPPPSRRGGKAAVHVVAAGGDEHDEDDDDDEDWGGSAGRKLNNGGRKSGSRSRQRW